MNRWRTELTLVAFIVATIAAQYVPALLPPAIYLAALGLGLTSALAAVVVFTNTRRAVRPSVYTTLLLAIVTAIVCAIGYVWLRADLRLSDELPRAWEGREIEIVGVVDEMPQLNDRGIRFAFRVEQVLTADALVPSRIALGWYKPSIKEIAGEALPEIRAGERWRWTVRLKRPHGYANPNGFDIEAWLLENDIRAQGNIQVDALAKRVDANAGAFSDRVHRMREHTRDRMRHALKDKPYAGVLIALAIGDQQAISQADWALFNSTAVSHLLSISGAHVTLFASWFALAVFFVWRRAPSLTRMLPAQKAAALAAAIVACGYAVLTGFAVPAQRTCYMLLIAALALSSNRQLSPWLILLWAAAIVLIIDPWAALAVGFWFSFVAVALLLYVTQGRIMRERAAQTMLKTQAAVTLGLAPISLAFFQQVSLVGPLANAVAIPLVTFAVIPLVLLWMIVPLDLLLNVAHGLIAWLAEGLRWLTSLATPYWSQHAPPMWTVTLALLGVAWLLAPRLVPHRWIGAVWCLPMFVIVPAVPLDGEFRMTALDVGQGTAVVTRTRHHTLLYDAGPKWTDDTDAGSRIVAPYLRASGSRSITGFVVSHLDIDHSGGANAVVGAIPTQWLLTSMSADSEVVANASRRGVNVMACIAGQRWVWDDVEFRVLHPSAESYSLPKLKTNDRSCVIKVTGKSGSALLTGDIEATTENVLAATNAESLRADVLLVPHHGSMTSSTEAFIDAVKPKLALINAGYRNRFGHPRPPVLKRYETRDIRVFRTDWHGAITVESSDRFASVQREREIRKRYWVDRPDPADARPLE